MTDKELTVCLARIQALKEAPNDLLEALKGMVRAWEQEFNPELEAYDSPYSKAQIEIAKAEGGA